MAATGRKPTNAQALSKDQLYRLKHPQKRMWADARRRAEKFGLPFSISPDDIVIPETCPVLGIPLKQSTGRASDCSPSVDRIVPELGYVPGNVIVMSNRANTLKNTATPDELREIADWVEKAQEEVCRKRKSRPVSGAGNRTQHR